MNSNVVKELARVWRMKSTEATGPLPEDTEQYDHGYDAGLLRCAEELESLARILGDDDG